MPNFDADSELPLLEDHDERAAYVVDGALPGCGAHEFGPGFVARVPAARRGLPPSCATGFSRVILVGGTALDGPRHIWWNFVSSSKDRIERAKGGVEWPAPSRRSLATHVEFVPLPGVSGPEAPRQLSTHPIFDYGARRRGDVRPMRPVAVALSGPAEGSPARKRRDADRWFRRFAQLTAEMVGRSFTFFIAASTCRSWCGLRPAQLFIFLGHLAARHQHRHDNRDVLDGLSHPEHAKPRRARASLEARRVDPSQQTRPERAPWLSNR